MTKCKRTIFSAVVQMMTGHNFMARHQSLVDTGVDTTEDARCTHCNIEDCKETSFHVLAECPAFGTLRFQIWHQVTLEHPFNNLKNKDIIRFMKQSAIPAFVDIMNYIV